MKAVDFIICFVAVGALGLIVSAMGCTPPGIAIGLVAMLAIYGGGHAMFGAGADQRRVRAHNVTVHQRNAQRDKFWAAGGEGDPPNLVPLAPMPAKPSYMLGIVACLLMAAFVYWVATH